MTKQTEAMKLALEAITTYLSESPDPSEEAVEGLCDAASILKKSLAEQPAQQEPVALQEKFSLLLWDYQELERAFEKITGGKWIRKSNTPQRTWVGLSGHEQKALMAMSAREAVFATEAKLKEKNNG